MLELKLPEKEIYVNEHPPAELEGKPPLYRLSATWSQERGEVNIDTNINSTNLSEEQIENIISDYSFFLKKLYKIE